jgi:hypothetical protein
MLLQNTNLGIGFHPCGNHIQIQGRTDGDDRPGNGCIFPVLHQVLDEGTVDLDRVERKTLELA